MMDTTNFNDQKLYSDLESMIKEILNTECELLMYNDEVIIQVSDDNPEIGRSRFYMDEDNSYAPCTISYCEESGYITIKSPLGTKHEAISERRVKITKLIIRTYNILGGDLYRYKGIFHYDIENISGANKGIQLSLRYGSRKRIAS